MKHWYFVRMIIQVPGNDYYSKSTMDHETGHTIYSSPEDLEQNIYKKYGYDTRIMHIEKID